MSVTFTTPTHLQLNPIKMNCCIYTVYPWQIEPEVHEMKKIPKNSTGADYMFSTNI